MQRWCETCRMTTESDVMARRCAGCDTPYVRVGDTMRIDDVTLVVREMRDGHITRLSPEGQVGYRYDM